MALYTEKNFNEAHNPLSNYGGNDAFVKGQIYAINNGGDLYNYSNNLKSYNQALEDAKANDNDNFFTGIGDLFVGRGADKLKADMADEYIKDYSANPYEFAGNDYNEKAGKIRTEQDFGQGRAFNGGLIGSLINPITQVGKAGADLASGIGGNWDAWNKRDHLSDIGALGETALTIAPFAGAGIKSLKGGGAIAKAGANTLGKTMLKGAGYGAGYSLAGGLKDMGSENFDGGQLALNTLLGGTIGGGMAGLGYGIGKVGDKLANIAKNNRTTATTENLVSSLYDDMGNPIAKNGVSYQDALKKAGLDQMNNPADYQAISNVMGGGSIPEDWIDNPSRVQNLTNKINTFVKELGGETNTPSKPGLVVYNGNNLQSLYDAINRIKTIPTGVTTTPVTTYTTTGLSDKRLGQIGQGIGDLIKDLPNTTKNAVSKVQNSKVGTNVANLLKTKKGKVLLGGTAGLTLAGLMKNRNDNTGQLSDKEMQELYNYVYGGQ